MAVAEGVVMPATDSPRLPTPWPIPFIRSLLTRAMLRRALAVVALVGAVGIPAHAGHAHDADARADDVCRSDETAVVVDTRAHLLHLCAGGAVERSFTVSLGTNGVGKQHQGDNRTPLGSYPLGPPRASQSFHVFVPVGYPTRAQARLGFTGSAIGIHGPPRDVGGLAQLAMMVRSDWTAGCIAVATDEEIDAVAAWIRKHAVKDVRLYL
jgi:L,D-peptidoglycan transpeptidase YkuD (ErfK/YbiS/YcfS/YnhG family)